MDRSALSLLADGLTLARLLLAVALVPAVWSSDLTLSAVLLSVAWLTDVLDGRLARASGHDGRLARWDVRADVAVAVGLLAGLGASGDVPVWLLVIGLGLLLAFALGSVAAGMLLQLCAYVPLLLLLWSIRTVAWWIPLLTAALIGLVDWRRLVMVNIPGFVHGFRLENYRRSR